MGGTETGIIDVLIIGAGACGLAMASRLCESSPSALFTDEEHQRYHWIKKHGHRMALKNRKKGDMIPCASRSGARHRMRYSTLVLDATSDSWMGRWEELFSRFDITHLRSPMFFHVDPQDRDSLLARAYEENVQDQLLELRGCVGKEISKHLRKARASRKPRHHSNVEINEREKHDYFTPPQGLFMDHCRCVAERYGLGEEGLVRKERVQDIRFGLVPELSREDQLFSVRTDRGATHHARTVVLAVGPGNVPKLPTDITGLWDHGTPPPRVCHAMQLRTFPDPAIESLIRSKARPTAILIVGGGLTSAQLSDLAIRRGVSKVWHLMRGPPLVKVFDVDLAWAGKFRNVEQAHFWGLGSDAERLEQIRDARGGGSITPLYYKRLKAHASSGRLELRSETRLVSARFDEDDSTWRVATKPAIDNVPKFDYIYFATGIEADITTLPYLQTLHASHPIDSCGGLPCLNDDLMWRDDVPLFVTGRFAGLRVGPFAGNLGGARAGAERISWAIEELLESRVGRDGHGDGSGIGGASDPEIYDDDYDFVTGRNNMFRKLSIVGEGEW